MWQYHMQTHTQEYRTKVACEVCNAEVLKGMLPEHIATQHFNSVWTCKKCGRKWRTCTHYYIHISRPCRQIENLENGNGNNKISFLPGNDNENKNIVQSSTALTGILGDIKDGMEESAYSALGGKESITEHQGDDRGHFFNPEYEFYSTLQRSNAH
jgi:hypothetical protein